MEHDWDEEKVECYNCLMCVACLGHGTKAMKTVVPYRSEPSFLVKPATLKRQVSCIGNLLNKGQISLKGLQLICCCIAAAELLPCLTCILLVCALSNSCVECTSSLLSTVFVLPSPSLGGTFIHSSFFFCFFLFDLSFLFFFYFPPGC